MCSYSFLLFVLGHWKNGVPVHSEVTNTISAIMAGQAMGDQSADDRINEIREILHDHPALLDSLPPMEKVVAEALMEHTDDAR